MTGIQDLIEAGGILVIDGGMGTELERRGVPMDSSAWAGSALKSHPDIIRTIHRDFVEAGADIVIANTYAAAPHVLRHAGIGEDEALALNRLGCDLVCEAVGEAAPERRIWIAGSLSSFYAGLDENAYPRPQEARRSYALQARTLADSGCDLLIGEMMHDDTISPLALEAAAATGLPVWAGFSVRTTGGRLVGFDGRRETSFDAILDACLGGVHAAGIMHSEIEDTRPGLEHLGRAWTGPLFAYPHSGSFRMPNWQFDNEVAPGDYAREAAGYVAMGVAAVGGCCGMAPRHIAALKAALPAGGGGRERQA